MSKESVLDTFLIEYQQRLEKSTLRRYEMVLQDFFKENDCEIEMITSYQIRKWVLPFQEQGNAEQTINIKISALKTFFKYCMEEGIIKKNPMSVISLLQVPEKPAYYLTDGQLHQLRQLVLYKLERRVIIELLYTTGMRISEMLAIQREQINWEERFIFIPKSKRKKERIVCFTRTCADYLETYLSKREDDMPFVFLAKSKKGPPTIRTIQYHFEEYSKELGFALSPHTLRHTFAAHLAKKRMPLIYIQTLLGHESSEQTQYYARLYHDAQKELYDYWMN